LKALGPSLALALSGPGLAALGSPDPLPADRLCAVAPPPQAGAAAAERLRLLADLAHSLGAALRVEGADDQVRLEILEGTGCDEATGEAVGPPLPAWSFLTDVWTVADREATCAHRGALLC